MGRAGSIERVKSCGRPFLQKSEKWCTHSIFGSMVKDESGGVTPGI